MKRIITLGTGILALLCAVLSARLGIPQIAFGVAAMGILSLVLSAWDRLDSRTLPYLIYLLAVAFLFQTTLISDNLIGTDIHTEYYFFLQSLDNGWNSTIPHAYNTAVGTTVLAPALARLGIPGYWIYKAVFPALFALAPVLLFQAYRKEFGDRISFAACVLVVTTPSYLIEVIGLPRQMLGMLMLAAIIALLVIRPARPLTVAVWVAGCAVLGCLFHYVMGPIIIGFLIGAFGAVVIEAFLHRKAGRPLLLPALQMVGVLGVTLFFALTYYSTIAGGIVTSSITGSATSVVPVADNITLPGSDIVIPAGSYLGRHEPAVRAALGLDFGETNTLGKFFRLFQGIIQLVLVIGCIRVILQKRKPGAAFLGLAAGAVVLMAVCVLVPRFSNLINATRFYMIALLVLSPLLVIGAMTLFRNLKGATICLFVPYVLLTTGVAFELTGQTDISRVVAPYSIALSNQRIHATGEYTADDLKIAEWIAESGAQPVFTDIDGMLLLSQRLDPYSYISQGRTGLYYKTHYPGDPGDPGTRPGDVRNGWGYLPRKGAGDLPGGAYVFLTTRSSQTGTMTFKPNWQTPTDTASGMRVVYTLSELGLPGDLQVIKRSGDAILLRYDGTPLPVGLEPVQTWSMPTQWDPRGHSQGVATDGETLWWSLGSGLAATDAHNPDWEKAETNFHLIDDIGGIDEVTGISLQDGCLYAASSEFIHNPYRVVAAMIDPVTLQLADTTLLYKGEKSRTAENVVWHDGFWWAAEFESPCLSRYTPDWRPVDTVPLPGQQSEVQGIAWSGDTLWVTRTRGPISLYYWDGSGFRLRIRIPKPPEVTNMQSLCVFGDTVYIADCTDDLELLHKFRVVYAG